MKKIIIRSVVLTLGVVAIFISTVLVNSSGTTDRFAEQNGIAEIRDITINGVQQRILIRGADKGNPLLLHLHGGPGGADQAIIQSTGKTLEDLFTVIYWDQRGSAASYYSTLEQQTLTLEQITDDGIALSKILLKEFGREKLYLQGHSWGTLLGVHMASKAPTLFTAYFGIGQFADAKRSEKLSWRYAVAAATKTGDQSTVNKLLELGSPPYKTEQEWIDKVMVQRSLMRPYENPEQAPLFTMLEYYKIFLFYDGYRVSEKLKITNGIEVSMNNLWPTVIDANLIESHTTLQMPVYIFQGKHDQHTVTQVAKEYYQALKAPKKIYYEFSQSAHFPHINEYTKYHELVKGVLEDQNNSVQ